MLRSILLRGGSACALSVAHFGTALAQEALPPLEVGAAARPKPQPQAPTLAAEPSGLPDANGNLPMDVYVVPDAVTATKMEVPIRDVPQSIQVITPQKLEDLGPATNSYEIAESVSGVFANPTGGSGVGLNTPAYVIRGFDTGGKILRDGMLRDYTTQPIDLSGYDHVEFLKGPSSTLYGNTNGSYGGIVNYITKKPTDKFFSEAAQTIGSFGEHRTTVDFNAPLRSDGSVLFRLNAAVEDSKTLQHHTWHNSVDISPSLVWTIDNDNKLTITGEHTVTNSNGQGAPGGYQAFLLIPRWTYPGDIRSRQQYTQDNATLKFDHRFNESWRVTAVADYNRQTQYLPTSYGQGGFDGTSTIYLGSPYGVEPFVHQIVADQLIGEVDFKGKFETAFLKHNLLVGLYRQNNWARQNDVNVLRGDNETINIWYPIYPYDPFFPTGSNYPGSFPDAAPTWGWTSAAYAQDLVEVTNQVKVMLGGRYDYAAQWVHEYDPTFQGLFMTDAFGNPTTVRDLHATYHKFSPHVGVVYQPFPETSLFGAWGQSFQPNSPYALIAPLPGHLAAPETGEQYDIGLKQQFLGGKGILNITLFDVDRKNVVVPNIFDLSGRTSLLNGEQHSHGVELDFGGEIWPNLRVTAAATFQHAIVTKEVSITDQLSAIAQGNTPSLSQQGSDLLGAPRRFYSLSGVYSFKEGPMKGLEVGATLYYAARMPALYYNTPQAMIYALAQGGLGFNAGTFSNNNQYPFTLAPIQRLDLMAAYQITERFKVQFNVYNLTDRANWTAPDAGVFHPRPRSIFGTLSYRMDRPPEGIFAP